MTNVALARAVLRLARQAGVEDVCVCAGSRNSPLVAVLTSGSPFRLYSFFDERSAAFFALGRWKVHGRPVAVVTTSGTAVAELLPATVEAFYQGAPLLLITADRPASFRETGAPQTIEQVGIFGKYVEHSVDLSTANPVKPFDWKRSSALHINVAFDEPLIDGSLQDDGTDWGQTGQIQVHALPQPSIGTINEFMDAAQRPLMILGSLPAEARDETRRFVRRLSVPVYAEATSGLREDPAIDDLVLRSGERILGSAGFDAILRIGGVPSIRFWRDLDGRFSNIPVLTLSHLRFSGLSRGTHITGDLPSMLSSIESIQPMPNVSLLEKDRIQATRLDEILDAEPAAEPSQFRDLSRRIPPNSRIFLGNSLPIREWDLAAQFAGRNFQLIANRGANGIDGELSTFLGTASADQENWAIVGDLTALYDLSAPWVIGQLDPGTKLRIVVVNNGGGRIFSRVGDLKRVERGVREVWFENVHNLHFGPWAALWNLPFEHWSSVPDRISLPDRVVVELTPDIISTERFWRRYDELWGGA
ncbi:MAG: 2-succinyl-5-enolpyruvyl-6-hydroxy-3-cyclohexene-1-carboxylic-acid synthase [Acidobacteriota bacterium]